MPIILSFLYFHNMNRGAGAVRYTWERAWKWPQICRNVHVEILALHLSWTKYQIKSNIHYLSQTVQKAASAGTMRTDVHTRVNYRQTDTRSFTVSQIMFLKIWTPMRISIATHRWRLQTDYLTYRSARQNSERSLNFSWQSTKRGNSFLLGFSRCLILAGKYNNQSG